MIPIIGTYPDYFVTYISKVNADNVYKAFENNSKEVFPFLKTIPEALGDYAYAERKWTIKQLILHISDAERVFSYRALRFGRGDAQQPLPFDEDLYAANSNADKRTLSSIIEEYELVNKASIHLFNSFSEKNLNAIGKTASGNITVNAIGFIICGHALHHIGVLKERYMRK